MNCTEPNNYNEIMLKVRCPTNLDDAMYVAPANTVAVRCKSCNRVHSLALLRQLRPEVFAPCFPDGTAHDGYIGAVKTEAVENDFLPYSGDYGRCIKGKP